MPDLVDDPVIAGYIAYLKWAAAELAAQTLYCTKGPAVTTTAYTEDQIETWRAHHLLANHSPRGWEHWQSGYAGRTRVDALAVTVVERLDDDRARDDYYEYDQGSTAPAAITFKAEYPDGGVRYFQKHGEYDSYGRISFYGDFIQVEPITRTVTGYQAKT
ncbi:hypothetical protein ACFRAQ_34735 [Nocardia sp. NPDC056611]|uniref:hypothetical protein n=1 Tax=Nocardia sp. NPDC056611 TaxID=3345877 RepID=UPI00366F282C